ncbi:hypothetical protein ACOSQ4_023242 [Xanthoceras sorbifolium]
MHGNINRKLDVHRSQKIRHLYTFDQPTVSHIHIFSNNLQLENTSQASTSVTNVNRSVQHTTLLAMVKAPSKFQDAQQSNKTLDWR